MTPSTSPPAAAETKRWRDILAAFLHPRVITMLFLGFSSGLPLLLIFSSLSLWLREVGVERSVVTLFSWAALGYSFKFVWAPLVDTLALPLLGTWLGRRRSWMLFSQLLVIIAILCLAAQDPQGQYSLVYMSVFAVMLGFSSATQDIVVDAYRIESAEPRLQALMSSTYIAGYRIGMLVAGAGVLFLASHYGSTAENYSYAAWRNAYLWMAVAMTIGVATTLIIAEPLTSKDSDQTARSMRHSMQLIVLFVLSVAGFILMYAFTASAADGVKSALAQAVGGALAGLTVEFLRLLLALACSAVLSGGLIRLGWVDAAVVTQSYVQPVKDFFMRYGSRTAWLLLLLIGVYRTSDIVLGVISNVFYQDMGFTKIDIATVSKTYGLFLSIAGGFLGGALAFRYGVIKILLLGAVLSAATNLLFLALTADNSLSMLYVVISADNLSAGLASAAFVAFLSALTNIRFTAVQYALFTSLMTLLPKALGGYSGSMVDVIGYNQFFVLTTLLGLPALVLVWLARGRVQITLPPIAAK